MKKSNKIDSFFVISSRNPITRTDLFFIFHSCFTFRGMWCIFVFFVQNPELQHIDLLHRGPALGGGGVSQDIDPSPQPIAAQQVPNCREFGAWFRDPSGLIGGQLQSPWTEAWPLRHILAKKKTITRS